MQEFEPVLCVYRAGTWPVQWRSRPCLQYHEPLYVRRGGMCRRMLYGRNRNHPLHHVFWPRVQLLWLQRHLPVLWGWDLWRYRMLCWRHDSSSIKAAILSPTGSAGRRVGIPTSDLNSSGVVEVLSSLWSFLLKCCLCYLYLSIKLKNSQICCLSVCLQRNYIWDARDLERCTIFYYVPAMEKWIRFGRYAC